MGRSWLSFFNGVAASVNILFALVKALQGSGRWELNVLATLCFVVSTYFNGLKIREAQQAEK